MRSFYLQRCLLRRGGDEENSVCFASCCSYDRIAVRCPYDRPSAYKTVHRTVLLYGVSLRSSILCIKKQHIPLVCTVLLVEMRRIELLSENLSFDTSTGLVYGFVFFPSGHRKRSPLGHSFLYLTC